MIVVNSPSNNYSLDEKQVGTWVDGKPIYQKTYSFAPELAVKPDWTYLFSVSEPIKKLIGAEVLNGGSVMSANIQIRNSVEIWCLFAWIWGIDTLTLRYTKSTD